MLLYYRIDILKASAGLVHGFGFSFVPRNTLHRYVVAQRPGTIILSALVAHQAWRWMEVRFDTVEHESRFRLKRAVETNQVRLVARPASQGVPTPGNDAIMRKDANKLIIDAASLRSLLVLLATLEPLGEEFPSIHDETPDEVDI
jgi:antitoxin VapB